MAGRWSSRTTMAVIRGVSGVALWSRKVLDTGGALLRVRLNQGNPPLTTGDTERLTRSRYDLDLEEYVGKVSCTDNWSRV
ncbi:MAG: hypothetical protein QNL12_16055, partial [Acidimicrobiia bacterium]|nr:hypothetical protein [Acidimicrobiia bacterium]MDX2468826.1 hypothetical protein [Acidimicrobiia bacterium]